MTVYHVPQINSLPVLDPAELARDCRRCGIPVHFWGLANSVTTTIGMGAGSAFLLVKYATLQQLDVNGFHTITWLYVNGTSQTTITLPNYVLVSARAVTSNVNSDGAYLIELRDRRQFLAANCGAVIKGFNIPRPRGDGASYTTFGRYWPDTMKTTTDAYTWQEVLADLWALLPTEAGSCPTLAWYPSHAPYNLAFRGWRAWDAIGAVLDCCQSTLVPTSSGFTVAKLGAVQTGLSFTALASRKVSDWSPKTGLHRARAPETLRICFPVRGRSQYLTAPSHRWEDRRVYTVDAATGITGAKAGTVLPVWAAISAEMATDGATCQNTSECASAAAGLGAAVSDRIRLLGDGSHQAYHGLVSTIPLGEQVHVIRYRDYGDGQGVRTEYVTDPAWAIPPRFPSVNAETFAGARLLARTAERTGITYPATTDRRLPVAFQTYAVSGGGVLTYSDFSTNADGIALAPAGWLPPNCQVEIEHDGSWWRIVRGPTILHGRCTEDATEAEWASTTITLGAGELQVYRGTSAGVYTPQTYSGGSPVLLPFFNTGGIGDAYDKLVTVGLDADGNWVALVIPCDGVMP